MGKCVHSGNWHYTVLCKWKFIAFNYSANGVSVEKFFSINEILGRHRKSFRHRPYTCHIPNDCALCTGSDAVVAKYFRGQGTSNSHSRWISEPHWAVVWPLVTCISKMIQLFVYRNSIGDNIALYTLSRCQIILNDIPYCIQRIVRRTMMRAVNFRS